MLADEVVQPFLSLLLMWSVDVDLGFEDRHKTRSAHLFGQFELLVDNLFNASFVIIQDNRALFGTEDVLVLDGAMQQLVEAGNRLHETNVAVFVSQALINLENGNNALLLPQVITGGDSLDLAIHRHLEQDRRENMVASKRRAGDDPGPHLVDEIEHLVLIVSINLRFYPICLEGLRGRTAGLVQGRNESGRSTHAFSLLSARISGCHGDISFDFDDVFQRTRKRGSRKV